VHLCIWTTPDIIVHTNVSPSPSPQAGNPSSVGQAAWFTAWTLTGELWQAGDGTHFPRPFGTVLPVTESTMLAKELTSGAVDAIPRLTYAGGTAGYGGTRLKPAAHAFRQYGYINSVAFDVMDFIVSFVPFVGDVADIGEALYMLRTGTDKWGRPVT